MRGATGNLLTLMVEMQNDKATSEGSLRVSYKTKHSCTICSFSHSLIFTKMSLNFIFTHKHAHGFL